jgi:hypothetical protein
MGNQNSILSPVTRRRLEAQGYLGFSDSELSDYRFGIRFAYYLCGLLVLSGLIFSSIELLLVAMGVAFLAMFPPYHPFDYLYNYGVRHLLGKSKLPHRANQGRFACGIATVWVGGIIWLLQINLDVWANMAGGVLLFVATLVTTMDICIPSIIYNAMFKKQTRQLNQTR